ncbi:MAG TPA: hypothetical protein ENK48_05730 [Gammaproteobacteria bacterium]|nr:hypothetical protein [Gammaproteobacteria bacterium]
MRLSTRRRITGAVALAAGCLIIYGGDRLLGVTPELWWGLSTFSYAWMADIFLVPLISGIVVAIIFGLGGKWLCYFPPIIVRVASYVNLVYYTSPPEGAQLLTLPLWSLVVILVVEAAVFGGVFGEIIIKRTYGRLPRHLVYRDKREGGGAENR